MIKLIGTDHLMSKEAIEGIIKDEAPDVIGLELCSFREKTLLEEEKKQILNVQKDKSLLGKITQSIKEKAEQSGMDYGSDQKTALKFAKANNLPYVLLDMPIIKTQELFMKLPHNEQIGFQKELAEFQNQSIQQEVNEEEVLLNLKQKFSIAFEFLINMRNLYIAKEILKAQIKYPDKKIICFLGKGHIGQIQEMIKEGNQ